MINERHMDQGPSVALTHCFFCGEPDKIVMNRTTYRSTKVEAMHGKIVDMDPCPKCAEWMKKGVIFIGVRNDQQKEVEDAFKEQRIPNPYRTGRFCVMTDDAIKRIITPPELAEQLLKRRWSFLPDEAWDLLGIPAEVKEADK